MVAQNFKRERHEQKQILAACAKCPSILVIFVLCFGSCKQTLSSSCPNTTLGSYDSDSFRSLFHSLASSTMFSSITKRGGSGDSVSSTPSTKQQHQSPMKVESSSGIETEPLVDETHNEGGDVEQPSYRRTVDAAPSISKHKASAQILDAANAADKNASNSNSNNSNSGGITKLGLAVLLTCAIQNCAKNLIMRSVMKDQPKFLTSAAVLGSECLKLSCSVAYILFIQRRSLGSIVQYLKDDMRNTLLLIVPASAYNFQTSMEYVALANLNAAMFSVLVQTKLLTTALFSVTILQKRLKYIQVISLMLLTVGVMLCNLRADSDSTSKDAAKNVSKGIMATLGIALSSGFASVYTEKVIKGSGIPRKVNMDDYGLAYTQVQLAGMSILAIGLYAVVRDWSVISEYGLFHNFTGGAALSCFMSGMGGLVVAGVLKYADSILKGYATALSVVMTGMLSVVLFGTDLSTIYFLGIINVICAVFLYNGRDLDQFICKK